MMLGWATKNCDKLTSEHPRKPKFRIVDKTHSREKYWKTSCRGVVVQRQCDQIVILLIQYLAIYNNEHLPNTIKNGHSRFKILPNMKETLQKLPKNACLSGKILPNLVTLSVKAEACSIFTSGRSTENVMPWCSVTRFGKILPLWHNVKKRWPFRMGLVWYSAKFWAYFGKYYVRFGNF